MVKCHRDKIETNFQHQDNDYVINAAGSILTNHLGNQEEILYLKLPQNVQIVMYSNLFDDLIDVPYGDNIFSSYSICQIKNPKVSYPEHRLPLRVFQDCFFPNIYLENYFNYNEYTGILHCPSNCVIYNLDATYHRGKCSTQYIKPKKKTANYQYKTLKNNYYPDPQQWTKCGPIDLMGALDQIIGFNQNIVQSSKIIRIHFLVDIQKVDITKISLKNFQLSSLNYKDFLKIVQTQGTKKNIDQFIQKIQNNQLKIKSTVSWKKKIPPCLQTILDQPIKGKVFQYILNKDEEKKNYVQFIYHPDYKEVTLTNLHSWVKRFLEENNLYDKFKTLNKDITFHFTGKIFKYQPYESLSLLEQSLYYDSEHYDSVQFRIILNALGKKIIKVMDKIQFPGGKNKNKKKIKN